VEGAQSWLLSIEWLGMIKMERLDEPAIFALPSKSGTALSSGFDGMNRIICHFLSSAKDLRPFHQPVKMI
ncbi:MAG TPA: hypothetical protein PK181_08415, partial [Methanothrix soehngenii]|jgi:hypothetical protein|nr:hypothetical protein [Methanothrix soehngenii]